MISQKPRILVCPSCQRPMTSAAAMGPQCQAPAKSGLLRLGAGFMALVGGASMSVTLSACYGAPCAAGDSGDCYIDDEIPSCGELVEDPTTEDLDGDGYCLDYDCDEDN